MKIIFDTMAGEKPGYPDHRLRNSDAAEAVNMDSGEGDFRAIRKPERVYDIQMDQGSGALKSVYRYADEWHTWDKDIDLVPSPVVNDQWDRVYYTGDGKPKFLALPVDPLEKDENVTVPAVPPGLTGTEFPDPKTKPTVTPDIKGPTVPDKPVTAIAQPGEDFPVAGGAFHLIKTSWPNEGHYLAEPYPIWFFVTRVDWDDHESLPEHVTKVDYIHTGDGVSALYNVWGVPKPPHDPSVKYSRLYYSVCDPDEFPPENLVAVRILEVEDNYFGFGYLVWSQNTKISIRHIVDGGFNWGPDWDYWTPSNNPPIYYNQIRTEPHEWGYFYTYLDGNNKDSQPSPITYAFSQPYADRDHAIFDISFPGGLGTVKLYRICDNSQKYTNGILIYEGQAKTIRDNYTEFIRVYESTYTAKYRWYFYTYIYDEAEERESKRSPETQISYEYGKVTVEDFVADNTNVAKGVAVYRQESTENIFDQSKAQLIYRQAHYQRLTDNGLPDLEPYKESILIRQNILYMLTYITSTGKQSYGGTPSRIERVVNSDVIVSDLAFPVPPGDITAINIYRKIDSPEAAYLLVDSVNAVTDYIDSKKDSELGLSYEGGYDPADPFPVTGTLLGVPAPLTAPTVSNGTGTDVIYYVYTYVSARGDEGPPSPIAEVRDHATGDSHQISNFDAPPADHGIVKVRIYRTMSSATGSAEYQYVGEQLLHVGAFVDTVDDGDLGEVLPTETWNPPPENLIGLIEYTNGYLAGFDGKDLYFSEAFLPHAWPVRYRLTFPHRIVALVNIHGSYLGVLTEGYPYLVYGEPGNAARERINDFIPCLSKRGSVSTHIGGIFPSKTGMYLVTQNGITNMLDMIVTVDAWKTIAGEDLHCGVFDHYYYGFSKGRGFVFNIDRAGDSFVTLDFNVYTTYNSEKDGRFYLVTDDPISHTKYTDAPPSPPVWPEGYLLSRWNAVGLFRYFDYIYRSPMIILPVETNMSCARITLDEGYYRQLLNDVSASGILSQTNAPLAAVGNLFGSIGSAAISAGAIATNVTVSANAVVSINSKINVSVFADDNTVFEDIIDHSDIFWLPGGYSSRNYQVEVKGNLPFIDIRLATSPAEIAL